MDEMWLTIKNFPNYSVSSHGRVRNEDRGRLMNTSLTQQGGVKVGLVSGSRQYTRSVKVLVAEAFVDGASERFDTPMHLDGNQENNNASNLVWRPRWFAWKYKRQFQHLEQYSGLGPVKDRKSGLLYSDVVEASVTNGLLFEEVYMSLVNKVPTFPTYQIFDWVKL